MPQDDKASRILNAALQEFLATGFKDAKIEDIARRAGVGKGTVYQYYESKDKLFEAMIDDGMDKYVLVIQEAINNLDSLEQGLNRIVQAHLHFILDNQPLAYLFYANDIHLSENIKLAFSRSQQRIIGILGSWMVHLTQLGVLKNNTDYRLLLSIVFGTLNQYYAPHIPGHENTVTPEVFSKQLYQLIAPFFDVRESS